MARKITLDIVRKEFDELGYDLVSKEYINNHTPLEYICRKHPEDGIQKTLYCNIYKGQGGCHTCGREKLASYQRKNFDDYQNKIWRKNPHINLITPNPHCQDTVECYCTIHKKYFSKYIRSLFYHKSGCNECYVESMREFTGKPEEQFIKELYMVHPEIELREKYVNRNTPIKVYCKNHNYEYKIKPVDLLNRKSCCPKSFVTYKEAHIGNILESWGYKITRQKSFEDCRDKKVLCFDFYLDDFNILIEYDGENHYKPVKFGTQLYSSAQEKHKYTIQHDEIKNNYCRKHNIPLLRIPYWAYDDIEYFLFDNLVKMGAIEETTNQEK